MGFSRQEYWSGQPFSSPGPRGWQAARRDTGNLGPGPLPISPLPTAALGRAESLCVAQAAAPHEGSSGPTVAFATRILSLAPRPGGRSLEHLGPGRGPWAEGPPSRAEGSHVGPRAGWGPGARGSRARPGVSQKSPCLITHSRAAECDRGLLNLPIRDEISPSNFDGLHSIKQK